MIKNKPNLSQLVNRAKINPIFGMALFFWLALLIYVVFTKLIPVKSTFILTLTPFFAVGWSLSHAYLVSRKQDADKKETCYSYKGNLTELLITLHKFGFELAHESKTYMQLDLKRLLAKPKSIFLLLDKTEIKILRDRELIEAIAKSLVTIQDEPLQHKREVTL